MSYFDRYSKFKLNGQMKPIPGLLIPIEPTDKSIVYKLGQTRLDRVSEQYYGEPYYGFLIMLANPRYGGMEFDIKNTDVIRIPFPLNSAKERYNNAIEEHKRLYG